MYKSFKRWEARVKLTNNQPNKPKSAAESKTRTALKMTRKNFQDEELPNNMLTYVKLTKS